MIWIEVAAVAVLKEEEDDEEEEDIQQQVAGQHLSQLDSRCVLYHGVDVNVYTVSRRSYQC